MNTGIIFAIALILILTFYFIFRKRNKKAIVFLKILTVIYFTIIFLKFLLSDGFIWVINGGFYSNVYYQRHDVLQTILRWGQFVSYVVLPMAVFFKQRIFKNIALYFCLPVAIISVIYYPVFMEYYLDPLGRSFHLTPLFRHIYFSVELVLMLLVPILIALFYKHRFDYKNLKEWRNFILISPVIFIILMPMYAMQSLFGYSSLSVGAASIGNFVWVLGIIAISLSLHYIFRFKSYEDRHALVTFLALYLFLLFNSMYLMGFSIPRIPLQLCNLGAYFFLIIAIFKTEKLFHFAFVANMVGTTIAVLLPDLEDGLLSFWGMHFVLEHTFVFVVPLLMASLGIFPRLKKTAIKNIVIGFTIYFLVCLVSGTILNGYSDVTGVKVNYFYIFDLSDGLMYFPFLAFTDKMVLKIGRFTLYPGFQLFIYCGFLLLCMLFYWLLQKIYIIADDQKELRAAALYLKEQRIKKKNELCLANENRTKQNKRLIDIDLTDEEKINVKNS